LNEYYDSQLKAIPSNKPTNSPPESTLPHNAPLVHKSLTSYRLSKLPSTSLINSSPLHPPPVLSQYYIIGLVCLVLSTSSPIISVFYYLFLHNAHGEVTCYDIPLVLYLHGLVQTIVSVLYACLIRKRAQTMLAVKATANFPLYSIFLSIFISHLITLVSAYINTPKHHTHGNTTMNVYNIYALFAAFAFFVAANVFFFIHFFKLWDWLKGLILTLVGLKVDNSVEFKLMNKYHSIIKSNLPSRTDIDNLSIPFVYDKINNPDPINQSDEVFNEVILDTKGDRKAIVSTYQLLSYIGISFPEHLSCLSNPHTPSIPTIPLSSPITSWLDFKKSIFLSDTDGGYSYFENDDVFSPPPLYPEISSEIYPIVKNSYSLYDIHNINQRRHWRLLRKVYSRIEISTPGRLFQFPTSKSDDTHTIPSNNTLPSILASSLIFVNSHHEPLKSGHNNVKSSPNSVKLASFNTTDGSDEVVGTNSDAFIDISNPPPNVSQNDPYEVILNELITIANVSYHDDVDLDSDDDLDMFMTTVDPIPNNNFLPSPPHSHSRSLKQIKYSLAPKLTSKSATLNELQSPWELNEKKLIKIPILTNLSFFSWVTPLLQYGNKNDILMDDLDIVSPYCSTQRLLLQYDHSFKYQLHRNGEKRFDEIIQTMTNSYRVLGLNLQSEKSPKKAPNSIPRRFSFGRLPLESITNDQEHYTSYGHYEEMTDFDDNDNDNDEVNPDQQSSLFVPNTQSQFSLKDSTNLSSITSQYFIQQEISTFEKAQTDWEHSEREKINVIPEEKLKKRQTKQLDRQIYAAKKKFEKFKFSKQFKSSNDYKIPTQFGENLMNVPGRFISTTTRRSLYCMFWDVTGRRTFYGIILKLLADCFSYLPPILLNLLLVFVKDPENTPFGNGVRGSYGYLLALLLVFSNWFEKVLNQNSFFILGREGGRARSLTMALVYRKILNMSSLARSAVGAGTLNTILTNDSQHCENPYWMGYYALTSPLQCVIVISMLIYFIGLSALVGVFVLVIMIPIQLAMSKVGGNLTGKNKKITDKRINNITEILQGIKTVKIHNWESTFIKLIAQIRDDECRSLLTRQIWNGFQAMVLQSTPSVVATGTFCMYIYTTGRELTPTIAFTALPLFNILQTLLWALPWTVQYLIEFHIALGRISALLSLPERENSSYTYEYRRGLVHSKQHINIPNLEFCSNQFETIDTIPVLKSQNDLKGQFDSLSVVKVDTSYIPIGEIRIINTDFWSNTYNSPQTAKAIITIPSILDGRVCGDNYEEVTVDSKTAHLGHDHIDSADIEMSSFSAQNSPQSSHFSPTQSTKNTVVIPLPTIHIPRLIIPPGSFTCIVGPIGSGKSLLLACILGDIPSSPSLPLQIPDLINSITNPDECSKQNFLEQPQQLQRLQQLQQLPLLTPISKRSFTHPLSDICYIPQQPWIIAGTVRDNIILDSPYIPNLFLKTIQACALDKDIELMANGELTMIAERGSTLSGGQKQRISLARGVYRQHVSSIFIFDSPLSALDSNVSQHVYQHVLGPNGLLKNKTRILVTHQLQWTKDADQIISMQSTTTSKSVHNDMMNRSFGDYNNNNNYNNNNKTSIPACSVTIQPGSIMSRIVEVGTFDELTQRVRAAPSVVQTAQTTENACAETNHILGTLSQKLFPPLDLHNFSNYDGVDETVRHGDVFRVDDDDAAAAAAAADDDDDELTPNSHKDSPQTSLPAKDRHSTTPTALTFFSMWQHVKIQQEMMQSTTHSEISSNTLPPTTSEFDPVPSAEQPNTLPKPQPTPLPNKSQINAKNSSPKPIPPNSDLDTNETVSTGAISWTTYLHYLSSMNSLLSTMCIGFAVIQIAITRYTDIWLTNWASNTSSQSSLFYLWVYAGLQFGGICFTFITNICVAFAGVHASKQIHKSMLSAILYNPLSFFDITPLGRITNRFSSDLYSIDSTLPVTFFEWINLYIQLFSLCMIIILKLWYFIFLLAPMVIAFYYISRDFRRTCRQLRRFEATTRSNLFIHLDQTLDGITSIHSYGQHLPYLSKFLSVVDNHWRPRYLGQVLNRWLAIRLDMMGNIVLLMLIFGLLTFPSLDSTQSASLLGLLVTYALTMTGKLNWLIRNSVDTENQMNAIERCNEYCQLEPEWVGDPYASLSQTCVEYSQKTGKETLVANLVTEAMVKLVDECNNDENQTKQKGNNYGKLRKYHDDFKVVINGDPHESSHAFTVNGYRYDPSDVFNNMNPYLNSSLLPPNSLVDPTSFRSSQIITKSYNLAHKSPMITPLWPKYGNITFNNVSSSYRPSLPLIVHSLTVDFAYNVNLHNPQLAQSNNTQLYPSQFDLVGKRIALVGKTGAGKSSLIQLLLKLINTQTTVQYHNSCFECYKCPNSSSESIIVQNEVIHNPPPHNPSGISIDGVDIATIPFDILRQSISVLPQDPTLFTQSIRFNLSPEQLNYTFNENDRNQNSKISSDSSNINKSPFEMGYTVGELIGDAEVDDFSAILDELPDLDDLSHLNHPYKTATNTFKTPLPLADIPIWRVLHQVKLLDMIASLPGGLDFILPNSGTGLFSKGQQQLLCLARTMLKLFRYNNLFIQNNCRNLNDLKSLLFLLFSLPSLDTSPPASIKPPNPTLNQISPQNTQRILLLDEATSNVDNVTEQMINTIIKNITHVTNCTVLSIAHHLHTIFDYDLVLVMENGRIVEIGHPLTLLNGNSSKFAQLVAHETNH
jgi:ABC-type multidrug transport system fused ATPase/permease subunit